MIVRIIFSTTSLSNWVLGTSEYTLRSRWFMQIYFSCHQLPPSSSVKSQWNTCSSLSSHFLIFLIILLSEIQARNKGWTQAISSTVGRLLPFSTSHLNRKESPHHYSQVQTQQNRITKRFWMRSWRNKWIATISSSTQRCGKAFCTQWKVCPRLFGIASNLLLQTRLRFSAPEYTWAPRKNENSNHSPGKLPSPKPQGFRQLPK